MSEKYLQIGVPMQDLPRPPGSAHYKRVESSLSNPLANAIKFHDCFHNASMTNLRDLKDPVSALQCSKMRGENAIWGSCRDGSGLFSLTRFGSIQ